MILSELRDYLKANQRATLTDMAHRFDTEPNALRGMLEKWMAKGLVEKLPQATGCGSDCCHCNHAVTEIYEWVGSDSIIQ
jgi:putative ferrous iron transport protein C